MLAQMQIFLINVSIPPHSSSPLLISSRNRWMWCCGVYSNWKTGRTPFTKIDSRRSIGVWSSSVAISFWLIRWCPSIPWRSSRAFHQTSILSPGPSFTGFFTVAVSRGSGGLRQSIPGGGGRSKSLNWFNGLGSEFPRPGSGLSLYRPRYWTV
jgi:hypothetical protein